jgi:hypothetical protein
LRVSHASDLLFRESALFTCKKGAQKTPEQEIRMAHRHLKNSTLPPNMQEAAQLIGWAIQRMLKFVPPEEQSDTLQCNVQRADRKEEQGSKSPEVRNSTHPLK